MRSPTPRPAARAKIASSISLALAESVLLPLPSTPISTSPMQLLSTSISLSSIIGSPRTELRCDQPYLLSSDSGSEDPACPPSRGTGKICAPKRAFMSARWRADEGKARS